MPYRRRAFFRRRSPGPIVNSIKNMPNNAQGLIGGTNQALLVAKAVNTPLPTVTTDVSQGCVIKAVWVSIDFCGLGGTGVQNNIECSFWKNPGNNLTLPLITSIGSSNEKKFCFRFWRYMAMRNQDGNPPYHWEGWIKIPKRYQRMGTDDTLSLVATCTSGLTGHFSMACIYKWYR